MSQENVEIVRRSIDAFSRGDLEGVLETFAPEFELRPSGRFGDTAPVYRGRQGWVDFWSAYPGHDPWERTWKWRRGRG
jgi:ketosteroid isomerase-like protein